jgi:putative transposase
MELRAQIQLLALELPAYGYRRSTRALHRQGVLGNHKRVLRLMREDNLLCLRNKSFVRTTASAHGLLVHPNLLPEVAYLAVLLDAYSRRCIGWAFGRHLEAELALAPLQMALATRPIRPGLVHHSDRGVQYASHAYTALLKESGIRISMSRTGHPYDNAQAERFIKTLKYEGGYLFEDRNRAEVRGRIGHFTEEVDNEKRVQSALGSRPPAEFERLLMPASRA